MLSKLKTLLKEDKTNYVLVMIVPAILIISNHFIPSPSFNLALLLLIFIFTLVLSFISPFTTSLILLSTVSLEKFSIIPESSIKIYEILSIPIILQLSYLFYKNKLSFKTPRILSISLIVLIAASILGFANTPSIASSLKYTILFFYFVILSVTIYLTVPHNKKVALNSLVLSSIPVLIYGIYQAIAYKFNLKHLETMPGRVDGSFFEPDWFGMYLAVILAIFLPLKKFTKLTHWILLSLIFINILLTIARAAWLSSIFVILSYLIYRIIKKEFRPSLKSFSQVIASFLIAIIITTLLGLTPFSLKQRFISTFTGHESYTATQDESGNITQISKEEAQELNPDQIMVLKREDINVTGRLNSYKDAFDIIKKHPIFGIGLGGLNAIYSKFTNANNIILEILIGTGFIGVIPFVLILLYPFIYFFYFFFKKYPKFPLSPLTVSSTLALSAIIIPNMFNSGIFLGYFWIVLGISLALANPGLKQKL